MDKQQLKHFGHRHPLMLKEQYGGLPISCEACGDAVLGPHYSCNQCFDKFILHKSCAQLPREMLQHPLHSKHPLKLRTKISRGKWFECDACRAQSNAFSYRCRPCEFHLDVKCAFNSRNTDSIVHFSHKHVLSLSTENQSEEGPPLLCTGCLEQVLGPRYICEIPFERERSCSSIVLHQSCAKLSREIQHPMHHQHPLILNQNGARESHCDACGKDCSRRFNYSCFRCDFNLDLKCASEKGFKHFSHEHPLMFQKGGGDDKKKGYTGPLVVCDGCQNHILGPSYTCISTYRGLKCCFNLHKSCADLPLEIRHPVHRQHPLFLLNTIENIRVKKCSCNACNQPCRYRYSCSICDFNLDLNCASNWRKIIDTESHEHQFTVIPRKEMAQLHLICDVCGEYWSRAAYYFCSICQLWVHKECASFPRDTKIPEHQHRLKLTWSLEDIYPKDHVCKICSTIIDKCRTVYYCQECCGYVAHTTCMAVEYFQEEANKNRTGSIEDDDYEIISCQGCIRPITEDFYSCTKQDEESCHFYLHKTCARLPERTLLPLLHQHQLILLARAPSIDGVFQCSICGIFHQGFVYSCEDQCALPTGKNPFYLDLECSIYWENRDLKHESHAHPLLLEKNWEDVCCRGCGSKIFFLFSCKRCNFHLCIACVRLPLTARHQYDKHPLKLTYESIEDELGEYYCEICEGKRYPAHWFYWCKECEFDCHPHCIIGRYPQVKLGSTYKHDAHVQHPVTLVSKWKSPIRGDKRDNILPCEKCGEPCQGLVFECRECNINFHRDGCCGTTLSESSRRSPQIEELS
ncbi:putative chromatin regulator PHD family [Rosa chinensis]|uniref:Putative chromatin regulator PHD family n=1 Tax=Rosa chinensis TaxID=74649 RepID=A0A2P6SJ87_ROSCH|nr:putative chromatin regulator PHD family [Rosa chinensis]